jgi:hypothetical protein
MSKRGRKSLYDTVIKPRINEIKRWLQNGATEKQVCDALGISHDTFYKYKRENAEFCEIIKNSRQNLVDELRGALVKRALGFEYTEKKHYIKNEDGKTIEYIEETTKPALPDVAALNLCLKNYDPDNWANDPQLLKLRRDELELRKQIADSNDW